jgi:hypothetical protein
MIVWDLLPRHEFLWKRHRAIADPTVFGFFLVNLHRVELGAGPLRLGFLLVCSRFDNACVYSKSRT